MESKILIVTASLRFGGVERMVQNIANYYQEKKWSVLIVALLDPEEKVLISLKPEVRTAFFRYGKGKISNFQKWLIAPRWISFLRKTIRDFKPTCILSMTFKIGALCQIARRGTDSRLTIRETSDPKSVARSKVSNFFIYQLAKKADSFIFQTEWERSCAPCCIQRKGFVVFNPVIIDFEATLPKRHVVVTMGRLCNLQKRHDVLIDAFALFRRNHSDYRLEIYGDGPDKKNDQQQIHELDIDDSVSLIPATRDVHSKIADAAVFVLCSDFEGMSNALVEAFLAGIPVITTDWPGADEIVTDGENGIIVPRGDPEKLANSIGALIDDPEFAQRLCNAAKKEKNRFDFNENIVKYSQAIEGGDWNKQDETK
jgi:GalNAc-alpha-(1->4)-GalNAc-alpha-(1->3)-diNAcBac-PP-undecaprenol alpha-1,4-N-acetyl-D-galactosaminyltransferase